MANRLRTDRGSGVAVETTYTTQADIEEFAPLIRPEDVSECFAASGKGPFEALDQGRIESDKCFTARIMGEPAAIWGWNQSEDSSTARVWLLATELIYSRWYTFCVCALGEMGMLLEVYDNLVAWADSRNTMHTKWLEWVGFRPDSAVQLEEFTPGCPVTFVMYSLSREDLRNV